MNRTILAVLVCLAGAMPAEAAQLSKSYSYFSIGGNTLEEIEKELGRRGPHVKSTGRRHPGATRMEFKTRISYQQQGGACRVVSAKVAVAAKVILPRWKATRKADADVRLIWGTLSADIKRHEESHVVIAKNHGREIEDAVMAMRPQKTCALAAEKASAITTKILAKHDREQDRFDRVENKGFETRILRLLRNRMAAAQ